MWPLAGSLPGAQCQNICEKSMHQEAQYPGRQHGVALNNPDFALMGESYGALGLKVTRDEEFMLFKQFPSAHASLRDIARNQHRASCQKILLSQWIIISNRKLRKPEATLVGRWWIAAKHRPAECVGGPDNASISVPTILPDRFRGRLSRPGGSPPAS